jgi:hypothetical protein
LQSARFRGKFFERLNSSGSFWLSISECGGRVRANRYHSAIR